MAISIDALHPLARQRAIEQLAAEDRARPVRTSDTLAEMAETGAESKLQADCEAWLRHRGYWPRTLAMIEAGPPPAGWYIHLPGKAAKGNPLLLDLLILHNRGQYIEVELKVGKGRWKKHQRQLVNQGNVWTVATAYSVDDMRAIIDNWKPIEKLED